MIKVADRKIQVNAPAGIRVTSSPLPALGGAGRPRNQYAMRREQRLVHRVLRLWREMAQGARFPRRDQIEPSMLGEDWANCLVIAVQSPVQLSYFVTIGENLSGAHGPNSNLAG